MRAEAIHSDSISECALSEGLRYAGVSESLTHSLSRDASILSIVADLEGRDFDGLRRQWRAHLGGEAPAHLTRWLVLRVLAYRLQSDVFGDLDKSIRRNLRSEMRDGAGLPLDRRAHRLSRASH